MGERSNGYFKKIGKYKGIGLRVDAFFIMKGGLTMWNIKFTTAPSHTLFENAGELILKLQAPYSKEMVTVQVNPAVAAYHDKPNINVRHVTITKPTSDTKTLQFDLKKNNTHKITMGSKSYEIRLMNIGSINEQGQDFPTFDFFVHEL